MEWSLMTNTPLHLLFLDWKQAFGSIDHTAMLEALRKFGLSDAMIQLVSSIYKSPRFTVQGFTGNVAEGTVSAGIRQGCPLSPYLFIMVLTVLLHDTDHTLQTQGVPTNTWFAGYPGYDLEYADDTLLMALTTPQLQYGPCLKGGGGGGGGVGNRWGTYLLFLGYWGGRTTLPGGLGASQ